FEGIINNLRNQFSIIFATNNLQQAARLSDKTAFFYGGSLIEYEETKKLFTKPVHSLTQDYITGRLI
ncbi:MAG: phosphate ABC transporter ATP-binding protein, partial [Bacteroidia bacterium]|nr:phosphate ABC transporter ATP-binding protein [Bacteroidia bacterium]